MANLLMVIVHGLIPPGPSGNSVVDANRLERHAGQINLLTWIMLENLLVRSSAINPPHLDREEIEIILPLNQATRNKRLLLELHTDFNEHWGSGKADQAAYYIAQALSIIVPQRSAQAILHYRSTTSEGHVTISRSMTLEHPELPEGPRCPVCEAIKNTVIIHGHHCCILCGYHASV